MKRLGFIFTWLTRGAFVALMLALVVDSLGCATHFGTVKAKDGSESKGVYLSLGNTSGPAGLEGAAISIPSTAMAGEIFRTLGNVALALIPGGASVVAVERAEKPPETSPLGVLRMEETSEAKPGDRVFVPPGAMIYDGRAWPNELGFEPAPGVNVITTEAYDLEGGFMRARERPGE